MVSGHGMMAKLIPEELRKQNNKRDAVNLNFKFNQYLKRKPHSPKGAFQEGLQDYNVLTIYNVIYNNNTIEIK